MAIDIEEKTIMVNRGDRCTIPLYAIKNSFKKDDKIKFSIVEKNNYSNVLFQKIYTVMEDSKQFCITMTSDETRFDEPINREKEYWYEIEYNGISTLIGYDQNRAKKFILYPEAIDKVQENIPDGEVVE